MRIVIIGEEEGALAEASVKAVANGAKVRHFANLGRALKSVQSDSGAELLLVDAKSNIAAIADAFGQARIYLPIVAYGKDCSADLAAAAIRAGAKDFIALPPDAELIAAILASIAEVPKAPICHDPAMLEIVELAKQFAPADATVLITGESGTGKEVIARYLWSKSLRADRPFISVNCAAIPETLLESELFGHEKGAFTGALQRRIGKFEEADGGTLLLDEISEMDVRLQAKLLRAIQEREIDRVGGSRSVPVDIRLLATSNRNLIEAVGRGEFREDLLFRLNVLQLDIPPLRQRPKDIEKLAQAFMVKFANQNRLPNRALSPDAFDALINHTWPGNVRELENCMHRAVLLATGGIVELQHLRLPVRDAPSSDGVGIGGMIGKTVAEVERNLILGTLETTSGNRTKAAEILGISIRTLRNKLQQYGPAASSGLIG